MFFQATTPRVTPIQQPLPRVEPVIQDNQHITRALSKQISTAAIPAQPTTRILPAAVHKKRRPLPARPPQPTSPPAMNPRARPQAKATFAAPPAKNTRARASHLKQPTPPTLSKRITRVENEVQCALAGMDKATGKLLNYRQLLRHPAYNADWTISSANEFGRLASGIGGCIKGTNTIKLVP